MTTQPIQITRADTEKMDSNDPIAHVRDRFALPEGDIYLDGNSLGALPHGVMERLEVAVKEEWGNGLIRSWNDADWYPAPQRAGAARPAPARCAVGRTDDQCPAPESAGQQRPEPLGGNAAACLSAA